MNDDGRQPIAIGHLSDSGDLKIHQSHFESKWSVKNNFIFVMIYVTLTHELKQVPTSLSLSLGVNVPQGQRLKGQVI